MNRGKTGFSTCCLICFGAAVSIAEIEAGCAIGGNWLAFLAGHALGGGMFWAVEVLGASTGMNVMETTVGELVVMVLMQLAWTGRCESRKIEGDR